MSPLTFESVINVFFVCVFDSKVMNDKYETDWSYFMLT